MLCLENYVATLVIMGQLIPVASEDTQCYSEFCFTIPGSNQMRNFEGAKSWCSNNSSTLAAVTDDRIQNDLTSVLSSSSTDQLGLMYINVKLQQNGATTWYLLNGTHYEGSVNDQYTRDAEYRYYIYLKPSGNNNFAAYAANLSITMNYACEYDENMCSNVSSNSGFRSYGRCYVKYDNESLSWNRARERCQNNGGDLMMLTGIGGNSQVVSNSFNTSWLNSSLSYWVGVRWNNWAWHSPDNGPEIFDTNWSRGKPNNPNFECVCVDPNGNPKWNWTDCDCTKQRQFLCLKIVPTTTLSSTLVSIIVSASSSGMNNASKENVNAMALGVGIGVGGFIVIVIVVAVVVIVVMKRKKKAWTREHNNIDNVQQTQTSNKKTPKAEANEKEANGSTYAHILSRPPSKTDKKSSDIAENVIYTEPQFPGTLKSESSSSYLQDSVTSRGRNSDVTSNNRTRTLLPSSGDVYANVQGDE